MKITAYTNGEPTAVATCQYADQAREYAKYLLATTAAQSVVVTQGLIEVARYDRQQEVER
jgi:hypothetical protein